MLYNDEAPEMITICRECDNMHWDETTACDECGSENVEEVHKSELGYVD